MASTCSQAIETAGHTRASQQRRNPGVAPERVDTIIDFPAVEKFGVQAAGNADAASAAVLAELAALSAAGDLEVPIAGVFALDDVRAAYRTVEEQHTRGKLVLRP